MPLLSSDRMRFASLVYLCAAVSSLHAEKPFDFAGTPGKLPKHVRPIDYAIWIKPDLKKLTFAARETVKLNGEHTRALKFTGKINQFGRGLFYAKYQEQGTGAKKMFLGTQFEATDARRLFPCWDEPVFRARFQLTAVVPENWMA